MGQIKAAKSWLKALKGELKAKVTKGSLEYQITGQKPKVSKG